MTELFRSCITNCDSLCFNHKSHIESFAVVRLNVSISPTTMVNSFNNKKKMHLYYNWNLNGKQSQLN